MPIGNTGLGFEVIKSIAPHNPARIFLAARTEAKANAAIESIRSVAPNVNITFLPLDLMSLESVRAAAETFKSESQRLDILMLNAGIMAVPAGQTKDGFEIQMGTNHYGHFLLTQLLLPTLQATAKLPGADARIVNMTSDAHNMARTGSVLFSRQELDKCGAWVRYAYSKLANVLCTHELARRYPEITAVSIHPGIVQTDLFNSSQKSNIFVRAGLAIAGSMRSTPAQGALNQTWAATTDKGNLVSGAYYKPVAIKSKPSPCGSDAQLAEKFWDYSVAELQKVEKI